MDQKLYADNRELAKRLSAHRQTWIQENATDISAKRRKQIAESLVGQDASVESRWIDFDPIRRVGAALYDLIDAENVRAREITDKLTEGETDLANELAARPSPLASLDELLKTANLQVEVSIGDDSMLYARKRGSDPYAIAELSDGERAALLIAADVLTADRDSLVIIDEPERHLHRSISSPLIGSLMARRTDCAFVVATHDLELAMDYADERFLLLRDCIWGQRSAEAWDADLLGSFSDVPEGVRRAIAGSRRKVLFVEGTMASLDHQLYALLFDDVSIQPKGDCRQVEKATLGVNECAELNWVNAYGLIDRDDRTPEQIAALTRASVYATECYSVESLYYCSYALQKIERRQNTVAGGTADYARAEADMIAALVEQRDHLCWRIVERRVKQSLDAQMPSYRDLQQDPIAHLEVDAEQVIQEEFRRFEELIRERDLDGLVSRYPIRETRAMAVGSRALGFLSPKNYQSAVRTLVVNDRSAKRFFRRKLRPLAAVI